MSRRINGIVAAVLGLGCFVTILPAQESSRRTASKYRSETPVGATSRPNLSPPVGDPEFAPGVSRGRTATSAPASQEQFAPATNGAPGQFPGGKYPAPEQLTPADGGPPAELEDGRLRSILKRPRTGVPEEGQPATLPPTAPTLPPTSPSVSNELLRRVESGPNSSAGVFAPSNPSRSAPTASRPGQAIAASNRNAALRVEINGPQGVTVGKPAAYTVTLIND